MPQIGWFEILVVVVLAILIIGPKDFPVMVKKIGSWVGSFKNYFSEIQRDISDIKNVAEDSIFSEKDSSSLLNQAKGKLFINFATVSPKVHIQTEESVEAKGGANLEALMASSITQAREGTLYLMCGGKEPVFEKARSILEALSSNLLYIGPAGDAAKIKALVNMVMNCNTAALAEGLGLGDVLGLDLTMLRDVFKQTGAASRVLETDGEDMQNRDHECYFSAAHAAKDSGIALELAKSRGLDLPLAKATLAQYRRLVEVGKGELDKSGVAELIFKDRLI